MHRISSKSLIADQEIIRWIGATLKEETNIKINRNHSCNSIDRHSQIISQRQGLVEGEVHRKPQKCRYDGIENNGIEW